MSKETKSYIGGFLISLFLTIDAYLLVVDHILNGQALIFTIIALALLQLVVQLFFFLHLGQEKKPRWNLVFFISTFSLVLLVVVGSIWIMDHLNNNMKPADMEKAIMHDESILK